MSDLAELEATVEKLRQDKFAHLPADLVRRILLIEAERIEDRSLAMRQIKAEVLQALDQSGSSHA